LNSIEFVEHVRDKAADCIYHKLMWSFLVEATKAFMGTRPNDVELRKIETPMFLEIKHEIESMQAGDQNTDGKPPAEKKAKK
jgi:hypothetical protein